jgi:hypothetical protein
MTPDIRVVHFFSGVADEAFLAYSFIPGALMVIGSLSAQEFKVGFPVSDFR